MPIFAVGLVALGCVIVVADLIGSHGSGFDGDLQRVDINRCDRSSSPKPIVLEIAVRDMLVEEEVSALGKLSSDSAIVGNNMGMLLGL